MVDDPYSTEPRRRTGRRIAIALIVVVVLIGGWVWVWKFAAGQAQAAVEGWRVREAKAGRVYSCGAQSVGGFPFRIELGCRQASAELRNQGTALVIKTPRVVVAAEIYQPKTLVSQFIGPLSVAVSGHEPFLSANWTYGESRVTGTPRAPESASLTFERPTVERIVDGQRVSLISARRIELSGHIASGTATDHPVVEVALRAKRASAPGLSKAAAPPIDVDLTLVLHGLSDFSPMPWPERFRQLQKASGSIDVTQARISQGDTLAVGNGRLSIDAQGQLAGELEVTVAGLAPFLAAIGAGKAVQRSHNMDKVAGFLDRLSPGLGDVAREQAGANLGLGIAMLGKPATLNGRQAVTLPLRFASGTAYLGPIPLGSTPAMF
jgi:hypothetical protein